MLTKSTDVLQISKDIDIWWNDSVALINLCNNAVVTLTCNILTLICYISVQILFPSEDHHCIALCSQNLLNIVTTIIMATKNEHY